MLFSLLWSRLVHGGEAETLVDWLTVSLIALAVISLIAWRYVFATGFWGLATRNADVAIRLFALDADCLVDVEPSDDDRTDFAGPFKLVDKAGRRHTIFIQRAHVEDVQVRVARKIRNFRPVR
jgi:hypothetical protein